MSIEYGRFNNSRAAEPRRHRFPKLVKPRQEICALLKWFCFIVNCIVFIFGVTLLALGVYLWLKDPRSLSAVEDVVLNPSVVLVLGGLFVSLVALAGLFGALRDNASLLKTSVCLATLGYIMLVFGVFALFFVFFADSADLLSMNSIMAYAIQKYHINHNMADFVDYVQENLECCGIRSMSQGYRDWQLSEQFHCNRTNLFANPFPERCGVPFSCCRKNQQLESASGADPLLPAMRSLQCWQNAQTKRPQELENDLYVRGCMAPLRQAFESHAVLIGSTVAMILVPGLFYIFMEYVLARQIDYQHYLLNREARRNERRRKRELVKRDKVNAMENGKHVSSNKPNISSTSKPKPFENQSRKRKTTSAPPPAQVIKSGNTKRASLDNPKSTKRVSDRSKAKIRGRSATATETVLDAQNDPTGKVRHWILQQSDFLPAKSGR